MLLVSSIRERLSIVALDGEEYAEALETSASLGIIGGAIYDAMLAQCAFKAKAETIFSWNIRHYAQCGPDVMVRLRAPSAARTLAGKVAHCMPVSGSQGRQWMR